MIILDSDEYEMYIKSLIDDSNSNFSLDQIKQIELGLKEKLNVSIYAKNKYNHYQMEQLRLGLKSGLNVFYYLDNRFDWEQMKEIRMGLMDKLDVLVYANICYNKYQMREIRLCMLDIKNNNLNFDIYELSKFEYFDHSVYNKIPYYYKEQMKEIRLGVRSGLDVSKYSDPSLRHDQMREIRLGLLHNVDVTLYNNSRIPQYVMQYVRYKYKKINNSKFELFKLRLYILTFTNFKLNKICRLYYKIKRIIEKLF